MAATTPLIVLFKRIIYFNPAFYFKQFIFVRLLSVLFISSDIGKMLSGVGGWPAWRFQSPPEMAKEKFCRTDRFIVPVETLSLQLPAIYAMHHHELALQMCARGDNATHFIMQYDHANFDFHTQQQQTAAAVNCYFGCRCVAIDHTKVMNFIVNVDSS